MNLIGSSKNSGGVVICIAVRKRSDVLWYMNDTTRHKVILLESAYS